jgi:hypothetical protein
MNMCDHSLWRLHIHLKKLKQKLQLLWKVTLNKHRLQLWNTLVDNSKLYSLHRGHWKCLYENKNMTHALVLWYQNQCCQCNTSLNTGVTDSMLQSPWKADNHSASQETEVHYCVPKNHNWTLAWVRWIQSIASHPISLASTLILSSHLCPGHQNGLLPGFLTEFSTSCSQHGKSWIIVCTYWPGTRLAWNRWNEDAFL